MLSPIKNIFDKIIDFLLILSGGIAVNAIFEWLKDPKNMETVKGVFKFIQDNYLWDTWCCRRNSSFKHCWSNNDSFKASWGACWITWKGNSNISWNS